MNDDAINNNTTIHRQTAFRQLAILLTRCLLPNSLTGFDWYSSNQKPHMHTSIPPNSIDNHSISEVITASKIPNILATATISSNIPMTCKIYFMLKNLQIIRCTIPIPLKESSNVYCYTYNKLASRYRLVELR